MTPHMCGPLTTSSTALSFSLSKGEWSLLQLVPAADLMVTEVVCGNPQRQHRGLQLTKQSQSTRAIGQWLTQTRPYLSMSPMFSRSWADPESSTSHAYCVVVSRNSTQPKESRVWVPDAMFESLD
jgi:hypothetical protein